MQHSVVWLRELEPTSLRLDAEHYRAEFLEAENVLKHGDWDYLKNLTEHIRSFGAYSLCNQVEYKEEGIPFIRCKDIKNGLIDFSDVLYIDSEANKLLWKSEVMPNVVLFTMSGTVGNSAIATEDLSYPINSNQDVAKIKTNERLNPYYLSVYLQSYYGENQIARLPIGSVQQHIFLWQIDKLIVNLCSDAFQANIANIFKQSLLYNKDAIDVFKEAKSIVFSEIGLHNWRPKHNKSYVKFYSDTVQAGRVDAEYFQPKYEELVNSIKNYFGGWETLGNLVTVKKCIEVGSSEYIEEGIPFIRVSNISPFEITQEKFISEQLYQEIRHHQPEQGEILFSKDATPGIGYYISDNPPIMIPSSGILRLKRKTDKVNDEYLTLVLNSILIKEQVKRDVGGSVILHWRPDQVKEAVIPILPIEIQREVKNKVRESFSLRKKSKHLLECAKRAVEIAIEEDENVALTWLNKQEGAQDVKKL